MKLSELKRIAEEHGCVLREESGMTYIEHGGKMVAAIDNEMSRKVDTMWSRHTIYHDSLKPVITAAVEYAMTPIEDRKEDELFYVRYPSIAGVDNEDDSVYINYNRCGNSYEFITSTQFTTKEIEAMPESIQQAIQKGVLEVIEVSEVDG